MVVKSHREKVNIKGPYCASNPSDVFETAHRAMPKNKAAVPLPAVGLVPRPQSAVPQRNEGSAGPPRVEDEAKHHVLARTQVPKENSE